MENVKVPLGNAELRMLNALEQDRMPEDAKVEVKPEAPKQAEQKPAPTETVEKPKAQEQQKEEVASAPVAKKEEVVPETPKAAVAPNANTDEDVQALDKVMAVLNKDEKDALEPFLLQAIDGNLQNLQNVTPMERMLKLVEIAKGLKDLKATEQTKAKEPTKEALRKAIQQEEGVSNTDPARQTNARLNSDDPNEVQSAIRDILYNEGLDKLKGKGFYGID